MSSVKATHRAKLTHHEGWRKTQTGRDATKNVCAEWKSFNNWHWTTPCRKRRHGVFPCKPSSQLGMPLPPCPDRAFPVQFATFHRSHLKQVWKITSRNLKHGFQNSCTAAAGVWIICAILYLAWQGSQNRTNHTVFQMAQSGENKNLS